MVAAAAVDAVAVSDVGTVVVVDVVGVDVMSAAAEVGEEAAVLVGVVVTKERE